MQWADEMAYNAGSLTFPDANFVTRLFGQFEFTAPVRQGDIVKIFSEVESVGTTSCKILVWAINARTRAEVFCTFAVMVNVHPPRHVALSMYHAPPTKVFFLTTNSRSGSRIS